MPLVKPSPFTPERILAATDDQKLFERAQRALEQIKAAGIDPSTQPLDWAFALPATPDLEAEYDEEDESGLSAMERLVRGLLLPAALSDPDGGAPAIFYGDTVIEPAFEPRVNLGAPNNWIVRNLHQLAGEPRSVVTAMRHLLGVIAEEREEPKLAELAQDPSSYLSPPSVPMRPYVAVVVAKGELHERHELRQLLDVTQLAPIHWILAVTEGDDIASIYPYHEAARGLSSAHVVRFGSIREMGLEEQLPALLRGLRPWYDQMTKLDLVR